MLNIFNYLNLSAFLEDYVQYCKENKKNWSYGTWVKKLGFKSTSSISKVMNGYRYPSKQMVNRLVKYFNFSEKEKDYFLKLVQLAKLSTNENEKISYDLKEEISKSVDQKDIKLNGVTRSMGLHLDRWYHYTIYAMIGLKDFKEDSSWIAKRLRFEVSETEIKNTIFMLEKIGLIKRDSIGNLRASRSFKFHNVDKKDTVINNNFKTIALQCCENSMNAIQNITECNPLVYTFAVTESSLSKVVELMKKFRNDLLRIVGEDLGCDEVIQFFLATYPITKKIIDD